VRTIYNPYSANEEELHQYIYVCRKPKQTFDILKELLGIGFISENNIISTNSAVT
jgi:hypothetical protein